MPCIKNPNYAKVVKQNIDKLLVAGFIEFVKETTWLSPIVVVPKKNGKLRICIDFKKLNAATKKDPYPLPFIDEVLNIIVGYEDSFLNGYSRYHQISIVFNEMAQFYKCFIKTFVVIMAPINKLTEKTKNFLWIEECQKAWELIKQKYIETLILISPN